MHFQDELSTTLHRLSEATDYIVKVQAVSEVGLGHLAHLEFSTPKFHIAQGDEGNTI